MEEVMGLSSVLNKNKGSYDGSLNCIAENHKDAFLGRSKGILNSFGTDQQNNDLLDVIMERQTRKMRPAKVLI